MRDSKVEQHPAPVLSLSLEQALRASDEILELLPIATCICDAAGRIVQYNRRAVELWGRAPQPGQTHDQFTAQCQVLRRRRRGIAALQARRGAADRQVRSRRGGDGRARRTASVVVRADQHRSAVQCARQAGRRDQLLPGRHRAQARGARRSIAASRICASSSERWNATYEHAAIGIVEIDAEGRFLRVNEAICSITGLSRDELLGSRLFARTHPDDRDVDEELYRRQVAGDIGFYSLEKRFVRKDGRVIWIAVRSSTVRDADGGFLYGVRVVQDITDRKEAEERQKLLIDELNHRVKNTLATVQSLATQTARGTDSPEAFRKAFEGRLIALSQAHDQLTRRHWKSADLRDIVVGATAPYLAALARPDRDRGRRPSRSRRASR